MHMEIYEKLVDLALGGRLTTYSQIAPLAGLSMDIEEDRERISDLLGEILRNEVANDRPLLTAIVVHKGNDNNPGEGFFSMAHQLGSFDGSRDALVRLEFWVHEVGRVHTYWEKD